MYYVFVFEYVTVTLLLSDFENQSLLQLSLHSRCILPFNSVSLIWKISPVPWDKWSLVKVFHNDFLRLISNKLDKGVLYLDILLVVFDIETLELLLYDCEDSSSKMLSLDRVLFLIVQFGIFVMSGNFHDMRWMR